MFFPDPGQPDLHVRHCLDGFDSRNIVECNVGEYRERKPFRLGLDQNRSAFCLIREEVDHLRPGRPDIFRGDFLFQEQFLLIVEPDRASTRVKSQPDIFQFAWGFEREFKNIIGSELFFLRKSTCLDFQKIFRLLHHFQIFELKGRTNEVETQIPHPARRQLAVLIGVDDEISALRIGSLSVGRALIYEPRTDEGASFLNGRSHLENKIRKLCGNIDIRARASFFVGNGGRHCETAVLLHREPDRCIRPDGFFPFLFHYAASRFDPVCIRIRFPFECPARQNDGNQCRRQQCLLCHFRIFLCLSHDLPSDESLPQFVG